MFAHQDLVCTLKNLLNKARADLSLVAQDHPCHKIVVNLVSILRTVSDVPRQKLLSKIDESVTCIEEKAMAAAYVAHVDVIY